MDRLVLALSSMRHGHATFPSIADTVTGVAEMHSTCDIREQRGVGEGWTSAPADHTSREHINNMKGLLAVKAVCLIYSSFSSISSLKAEKSVAVVEDFLPQGVSTICPQGPQPPYLSPLTCDLSPLTCHVMKVLEKKTWSWLN